MGLIEHPPIDDETRDTVAAIIEQSLREIREALAELRQMRPTAEEVTP